jgi:tRNA (mo5U34)-methyltransferase
MDRAAAQRMIHSVKWFHEFDFGDGLVTRPHDQELELCRGRARFIEQELNKVDFVGKSVLDIGCWDGYWSFYAERRGAKFVLATDDQTQNWAGRNSGLKLAKSLLGSAIETQLDVSIYDLPKLARTFDIILCLGVYYHLVDPIYAFAQVRHCCHSKSIAVFEGEATLALPPDLLYYYFSDTRYPSFVPSPEALSHLLEAAYFNTKSREIWSPPPMGNRLSRGARLWLYKQARKRKARALPELRVRALTVCAPCEGRNRLHYYRPPFGLDRYDPRFRDETLLSPES